MSDPTELRDGFMEALVAEPPKTPSLMVEWVKRLVTSLSDFIFDAYERLTADVDTLESRVDALEDALPTVAPPTQTREAPATRASASQPQRPGPRPRCQRCHATGHSTDECKTVDPAMTKKRVAKNARALADQRRKRTFGDLHPRYYAIPPFSPYAAPYPPTTSPPDIALSAAIADASELRRRAAQSSRDKRRSRRTTPADTATQRS